MYKYLFVTIGGLFILPSYASDYYDNLYQECRDNDFTSQIIYTAQGYCTPQGDDWPQCIEPDRLDFLSRCDDHSFKKSDFIETVKQYKWYYNAQINKEDPIPPICFLASTALGRNSWNNNPPSSRPYKANNKNYRYYHCNSSNEPKEHLVLYECTRSVQDTCFQEPYISKGQPPCSSKDYIHKVAKAFDEVVDCFDFKTRKEKEMIFSLLNHESRFLINKIEESGNEKGKHRCFGQINNASIETLNRYIVTPRSHAEFHAIYKKVTNSNDGCPFLEKSITPALNDLIENRRQSPSSQERTNCQNDCSNENNKDTCVLRCIDELNFPFDKVHINNSSSMICKTSQDPYSCLFYTIFNIKVILKTLDQHLEKNPEVNSMKIEKKNIKYLMMKIFTLNGQSSFGLIMEVVMGLLKIISATLHNLLEKK